MTSWRIDLGFTTNAVTPDPQLQWGVVDTGTSPPTPGFLSQFQIGDTVQFHIYNIGPLTGGTSPVASNAVTAMTVSSTAGVQQQSASAPYNGTPFSSPAINYSGAGQSTPVFGSGLQLWTVDATAQVVNAGTFTLTFNVTVNGVVFTEDPEMVVTPTG